VKRLGLIALLTAAVIVAIGLMSLVTRGSGNGRPGDPDNARRAGARALAEVLRDQGVQVDVVRTIEQLEAAAVNPSTTVLVGSFDYLGQGAADRVRQHAATARRLVLLEPDDLALGDLGVSVEPRAQGKLATEAGCSSEVADPHDRIDVATTVYRVPTGAAGCYSNNDGAAVVILPRSAGLPQTVVLGSLQAVTNAAIGENAHAALALRTLGSAPRLVWYVPGTSDLLAPDSRGQQLSDPDRGIPDWFWPGALLAALAFVVHALARGRRLGRVVAEPLPVVVRAVETTEARGRLYRRAADQGRAATSLRAGTRSRLATRLGVPRRAATDTVIEATARATGRDTADLRRLLDGPAPATDQALVLLAEQLADLEENVRRV